jgi:hypothetical protein
MPGWEDKWFFKAAQTASESTHIQQTALRAAGWKHTSSTPGSYWMWEKEMEGKTYLVDQATAVRIQENLDREAYAAQYPEEFED